jgi:hypothetical protein
VDSCRAGLAVGSRRILGGSRGGIAQGVGGTTPCARRRGGTTNFSAGRSAEIVLLSPSSESNCESQGLLPLSCTPPYWRMEIAGRQLALLSAYPEDTAPELKRPSSLEKFIIDLIYLVHAYGVQLRDPPFQ